MKAKPLPGRMSERSIQSTLNVIKKKLRDPGISTKEMLKLLDYQEKLRIELKTVAAEKIKAQLATLDAKSQFTK